MFSPVPTPEGTKETYWETKAPGSNVLGIGKDVSSGTYIASSVIAALVGAACTAQVRAMPLSGYFSFALPLPVLLSSPPLLLFHRMCPFLESRSPAPTSNAQQFEQQDSIIRRVGES